MADKSLILDYFKEHPGEWISPAALRAVAPDIPERTLRRRLAQLVAVGIIERTGDRRGARYRRVALPKSATVSPAPARPDLVFRRTSLSLLARVRAPLYTRPPVSYAEEWVASYVPNRTYYLTAAQRRELRNGKRHGVRERGGTYVQRIFNRLLVDLSYNSARLEGNTYSLAETERLLLQGVRAEGKLDAERVMILNHKEAIRYLVQNAYRLAPTEEVIRTLHYLLADSLVAAGMAGQVRDESIRISGTTYAPLDGKARLSRLLARILTTARQIDDPFEQSFFLLGHISCLQAFVDVNKRTARLASIIPLITNDYVPQSFMDVSKGDYLDALICFYELNETAPLADIYCWSYLRSCQHFDTSAEVLGFDEIAALYRLERRALVASILKSKKVPADLHEQVRLGIPSSIKRQHRKKFLQDVLDELAHLDASRAGGLGITKRELDAWLGARERVRKSRR